MSKPRPPLDRSAVVIGLATILAANFLYLAGLSQILDPMISMEPFYINMAQHPLARILTEDPAWGPLYAVWLKPFVALLGDPLAVYAANLHSLSISLSVLIYFHVLLVSRRAAVAAAAALFFLISDFNVPLSNKVSGFALLLTLTGFTLSELAPAGAPRMTVAAMGVLLASYARPELYPAAVCLWLAATGLAYRGLGESGFNVFRWPALGLVCIVAVAIWIGTPIFSPYHNSERLMIAFREHFAWNWNLWHHESHDFFLTWEQEFGGVNSIGGAVLNNPGAIAHHLVDNLLGTVRFLVASSCDHYPVLFPATSLLLVKAENISVSVVLFGTLILVLSRRSLRRRLFDRYGDMLVPYTIVAIFSLVSATVIFPLAHYLVIPGVLLMLAGTLAATLIIPATTVHSWPRGVLALVVCLAAVPRPFVLPSAYVVQGAPFKGQLIVSRPITDTIRYIRSLKLAVPVYVLTLTDGVGEMLGTGFNEVKIWQKGAQPLEDYIRENDVGVIVSLGPGQESVLDNETDWKRFENDPDAAGFTRLRVADHEAVGVYVRTNLMEKTGPSPPNP